SLGPPKRNIDKAVKARSPYFSSRSVGLFPRFEKKNPLDRLMQSNLKFWKRSTPQEIGLETSSDSHPLAPPRHATFPTKILKDFINNVVKRENPVVLDIGPVIGSNIEYFLNFGI